MRPTGSSRSASGYSTGSPPCRCRRSPPSTAPASAADWSSRSPAITASPAARPASKIGLPETKLGILPAWGGSTRLPRLIGLSKALRLILAGKVLPAEKHPAVDHVVAREHLRAMAKKLIDLGKPTRRRHHSLLAPLIRWKARRDLLQRTRGNYPAPMRALEVITRGINRSHEESLRLEREAAADLIATPESKNLIRLFFQIEAAKERAERTHTTHISRESRSSVPG